MNAYEGRNTTDSEVQLSTEPYMRESLYMVPLTVVLLLWFSLLL